MMSFSLSGGVEVLGFISPTDPLDTYPVIDPIYGIDGFRNVDLISDLDLIPNPRRRAGMVVGISGGTQYYKLNPSPWNGDITDWSIFNLGGGTFTGGTVSGPTNFTSGLTSNVISATTYQNLPTDVRVTGGTYSNGTATFTNNTGGTFSVTGFSTSGGTNPFRAMYDMAINVQSISILNALEGTSIPDGESDSYTKTIPLPFVNPDLVYCAVQARHMNNNSGGFSPITFGFTTSNVFFTSSSGSTANGDIRFIVTNNYTEVRLAGLNRLEGTVFKFVDNLGVEIPGGIDFPSYSQQNNNLIGVYNTNLGVGGVLGYTSSSLNILQSHSVLKSAYINGNNLVLLFKKRIVTTSELWTRLNINVYNIS
jgi:hypothetical protein